MSGVILRGYQDSALNKLRQQLALGRKRIMLYSPTGSGKTEIGMAMIRGAVAKGKRVGFVANRIHLVEQTSKRFRRAHISHGIIQGANSYDVRNPVTVCSIQTLARRGFPDHIDMLVIDEAHACAGSTDYRNLFALNNNLPIIGLSATPFSRGLGKHYAEIGGPLFEELVTAVTIRELIELGYLVDADIYAPSEPDLRNVRIVAGEYHEGELGAAVDQPKLIGDIVSHWLRLANGKPTVCFATNITHSQHIVEQFRAAGVQAEHIDCYTNDIEREAILRRVERGETKVISNVAILAEGWDFPACEVMILARPTKSLIRYIQMAGRVLRPFDGKEKALILDHSGSCKELGYPTDDLPLELDDGRVRASKKRERTEPLPKACPKCSFMKPPKAHACPKCGFAPQKVDATAVGDGELVKFERKPKGKLAKSGLNDQQVFSQLLGIANERGYAPGWAAHQFKRLYGDMPKGLDSTPMEPSPEIRSWVKALLIRQSIGFAKAEGAGRAGGHRAAA